MCQPQKDNPALQMGRAGSIDGGGGGNPEKNTTRARAAARRASRGKKNSRARPALWHRSQRGDT
eukprot:scaffold48047_cov56-Phaeocystis_antarctica.AAC.1